MLGIGVQNLWKSYGKKEVVKNVSFGAQKKEIVVILGPSGSGKTTTLRCIAGLEDPSQGTITINDKVVFSTSKPVVNIPPNKRDIGMVFQSFALWPHMTVEENVGFGLKIRGLSSLEIRSKVSDILEVVGLSGYESRYPGQLSGGQQQRVALARSLVYEPTVLLLDEPPTSLDAKLRMVATDEIKKIQQKLDLTMLWVTHDQIEAMAVADKIIIMNEGRIVDEGKPEEIYQRPKTPFSASFLGEVNRIEGKVIEIESRRMKVALSSSNLSIEIPAMNGMESGSEVVLFVKAERIHLSKQVSDELPYEVELVEFLGDRYKYVVRNSSHSLIAFSQNKFEQGEKVNVEIDTEFVPIFRCSEAN